MSKLFRSLLIAASASVPAAAQQPQAPQDEPSGAIVVKGIRDPGEELGRFVDALTDAPVSGQLSRFNWAVCPAAVGLGDAQNMAIVRRLRQVANAAAIPLAQAGCRPNTLLIVTGSKNELIDQLRRKYPVYFDGVPEYEIDKMKRDPSPAAAWHVEGRVDADGIEVQRDAITGQQRVERTDVPSRIATNTRPHFVASIVVVELDSLAGLTVTQLADYGAMRTFARTEPGRTKQSSAPTILSILDAPMGSALPVTLTEWDLAFLKSLYASSPDRKAAGQRSEMKGIMRDELGDKPKQE